MQDSQYIRGISFSVPAREEVRNLAAQIASGLGVDVCWTLGNQRIDVVGPRVAVDWFVEAAAFAQSIVTEHHQTAITAQV